MPTGKHRVTGYIRQELFEQFERFCQEQKVAHSKGIEIILEQFLAGDIPSNSPSTVLNEEILTPLIESALSNSDILSDLLNSTLFTERARSVIEYVTGDTFAEIEANLEQITSALADIRERLGEQPRQSDATEAETLTEQLTEGFTDRELAKHLGLPPKASTSIYDRRKGRVKTQTKYDDYLKGWEVRGERWYRALWQSR